MNWIARIAAAGTVPVYPAIGRGGLAAAEDLALDPRIEFVATPRRAALLLVVGEIDEVRHPELHRLHDQLPHPRATVWWKAEPHPEFRNVAQISAAEDPATRIGATFRALVDGDRSSEPDILPDEPPNPWRGKGDHGQGGEGMMGGTPYGRPMAMTAEDLRDGLMLDAYTASFGPFLPMLPPGLALDLTLQGDVIQNAAMRRRPFPQQAGDGQEDALRRVARMLRLLGLAGQAERFFRAAHAVAKGETVDAAKLRRIVRWSGAMRAVPAGIGSFGSPSADARTRFARWLDRATLAGGAAEARHQMVPAEHHLPAEDLDAVLKGLEWQEAMLVVNSIDIDSLRLFPIAKDTKSHGHDHAGKEEE